MEKIIFITKEQLLSERRELINQATKWLSKIVSISCLYGGRLKKTDDKEEILKYIDKLVRLNSLYYNRIYKIEKKLIKLESKSGLDI